MSAKTIYRATAGLFILFAVAHTVGFLSFTPPTAEAVAVRDAMKNIRFEVGGSHYSYGEFYNGFGLYISAYLAFLALLSWHLSRAAVEYPQVIRGVGWTFFGVQFASLGLTCVFFGPPQIVFSALATVGLGWGALMVQRTA